MGVPLAETDLPPGRRWNPWDIAISRVVDTARNRPLTVWYGDADDPTFHVSAGECAR